MWQIIQSSLTKSCFRRKFKILRIASLRAIKENWRYSMLANVSKCQHFALLAWCSCPSKRGHSEIIRENCTLSQTSTMCGLHAHTAAAAAAGGKTVRHFPTSVFYTMFTLCYELYSTCSSFPFDRNCGSVGSQISLLLYSNYTLYTNF